MDEGDNFGSRDVIRRIADDDASRTFNYSQLDMEVARFAREAAADIRHKHRQTIWNLIQIGQRLIEVKRRMPRQFLKWVQAECWFTDSTAENYMASARYVEAHWPSEFQIVGNLEPRVLYRIAHYSKRGSRQTLELLHAAMRAAPLDLNEVNAIIRRADQPDETEQAAEQQLRQHPTAQLQQSQDFEVEQDDVNRLEQDDVSETEPVAANLQRRHREREQPETAIRVDRQISELREYDLSTPERAFDSANNFYEVYRTRYGDDAVSQFVQVLLELIECGGGVRPCRDHTGIKATGGRGLKTTSVPAGN